METKEPALKYETSLLPAEFINWEREEECKHEYADGKIIDMAGASPNHNKILANIIGNVYPFLKDKPCDIYPSDLRIYVKSRESYFYPDATIICSNLQFSDKIKDTVINPSVIFGILSPSTEDYDTGRKFYFYSQIETLQQYVLIDSQSMLVRSVKRQSDGAWRFQELEKINNKLWIEPIALGLQLKGIYEGINFAKPLQRVKK